MARQPLTDPVAIRMPADVLASIDRIAETCDRPRSWVMVRALRLYLQGEGAEIMAYREARDRMEGGESEDLDDVIRELDLIVGDKVA